VRRARRRRGGAPLRVLNFDWHGMTKDLRERGAVEGLWALLESTIAQVGLGCSPTPTFLSAQLLLTKIRHAH
jgi:hypothetical protein